MTKRLVLASASPRRKLLLSQVGLVFETINADIDESILPGEDAKSLVERLSREKVFAVSENLNSSVIIGADTVVVKDSIMGKPRDEGQAFEMLKSLRNNWHEVITGFCIMEVYNTRQNTPKIITGHEITRVRIGSMSEDMIWSYIRSGEPLDKAGSYAIQGLGAMFVDRIEGCYFNVVGLPLSRLVKELTSFGIVPFKSCQIS